MNRKLVPLYILHILNDGYRAAFLFLLPFIARDLGLAFSQVGLISSTLGLMLILLAIPGGFIASRIGGMRILLYSVIFYSLSLFLMPFTKNIWQLVPVFYLGGIAFGTFHTIGFSMVARIAKSDEMGREMGNFTAIGDIGRVGIPTLALFANALFGWKAVAIGMSFIGIFCFLVIKVLNLMRDDDRNKQVEDPKRWLTNLLLLLKDRQFRMVTISNILDLCALNGMLVFLPFLFLSKEVGPAALGFFTGAFFIGSLIGKSLFGRLLNRIGSKRLFIISELCMAALLVIITLVSSHSLLFILSLVLGIFTKGTSPVITTLVSRVIHTDHHMKGFAVNETFAGIAILIAPLAAGVFADKFGVSVTFYVSALFAILATVPMIAYVRRSHPPKL